MSDPPGVHQHLQHHRSPWLSSGERAEASYSQSSANPASAKAEELPHVSSVGCSQSHRLAGKNNTAPAPALEDDRDEEASRPSEL